MDSLDHQNHLLVIFMFHCSSASFIFTHPALDFVDSCVVEPIWVWSEFNNSLLGVDAEQPPIFTIKCVVVFFFHCFQWKDICNSPSIILYIEIPEICHCWGLLDSTITFVLDAFLFQKYMLHWNCQEEYSFPQGDYCVPSLSYVNLSHTVTTVSHMVFPSDITLLLHLHSL